MPTDALDPPQSGGGASAGTPIVATDLEGLVTVWNGAAADTFGWEADEVRGEPCPIAAVARDEEPVPGVLEDCSPSRIEATEVIDRPVTVETRTGEPLELRLSQTPLHRDGTVDGVVATFTEHSIAEREAARLRETTGAIAHDRKNPLDAALASLSLLESDTNDEHVARAERCLDRMAVLVDELHAAGTLEPADQDPRAVSLGAIAEAAWQTTETADASLAVDDAEVVADPDDLEKLLANLIANAVDHGGDAVEIQVGSLPEGGFYFADDGAGVPPGEREAVFEFGYSGNADSTGYGLSIVERVADAHGWSVTLTDSETGGARFEFR